MAKVLSSWKEPVSQDFSQARLELLLTHANAVLRHDVDYVPLCALQMAQKEFDLGVKAIYYARPLGEYSDRGALDHFVTIAEMGHRLGIHVDLALPRRAEVPDEYMRLCCEADFQELSIDLPVEREVSFHAPPLAALWRDVPGFQHSMSAEWMASYVADSRGVFRRNPERALANGETILNLHPEWWWLPSWEASELRQREAVAP